LEFLKKYYVGILHCVLILLVLSISIMGLQFKDKAQQNVPTIIIPATKQEVVVHKNTRYPSTTQRDKIDLAINKYSKKYKVDPLLIRSVINTESSFNPKAKSSTGDSGLMQINKIHKLKNPTDINTNVEFGTKMMSRLIKKNKGNVERSLWEYNCGSGNVRRGIIPKSTRRYARKILAERGKV